MMAILRKRLPALLLGVVGIGLVVGIVAWKWPRTPPDGGLSISIYAILMSGNGTEGISCRVLYAYGKEDGAYRVYLWPDSGPKEVQIRSPGSVVFADGKSIGPLSEVTLRSALSLSDQQRTDSLAALTAELARIMSSPPEYKREVESIGMSRWDRDGVHDPKAWYVDSPAIKVYPFGNNGIRTLP